MTTTDFTTTNVVDQMPKEVFGAINKIMCADGGLQVLEGSSQKLNDEFTVRFGDYLV